MKLGGLFSGVGGFELAWTQLGHEVAWMCEWDAKARKVLEARFPGVPIYPDVRDLDPAEVEAVDVLTGGSPCQGFSVAGSRSGMEHAQSQLFADYVRIMEGLADRGLQYALWENVPGVLSIKNDNGERTFTHVIGALVGAGEPVRLDPKRKWNVGLAARDGRAVAWRVLDSRYFGVAQRRRRVFACVAFGDSCEDRSGRSLLAQSESLPRDSSSRIEEGKAVARGAEGSLGADGSPIVFDWQMHQSGGTLPSTRFSPALSASKTPAVLLTDREGKAGGGKGPLLSTEQSLTLKVSNNQVLFEPRAFDEMNFTTDKDTHHVLRAGTKQSTGVMVPQAYRKAARAQSSEGAESWVEDGQANTLNAFDVGDTRTTHAIVQPEWSADETGTIQARGYKGLNHENVRDGQAVVQAYGVRRLTPVECERLQSFPDGWTEPAGSDSARYKAMGNAVTVNVVRWILGRMVNQ